MLKSVTDKQLDNRLTIEMSVVQRTKSLCNILAALYHEDMQNRKCPGDTVQTKHMALERTVISETV